MADPLDAYNREIQRRSGPFGLNPAQTRGGALLQAPLYAAEGLGELGNFLLDAPSQMGEAALDYLGGPSKFARDVRSGAIPESEIPAGVDLVDLLGETDPTLGAPEFLPDDYSAGEIFSYDPTGMGLTKSSTPPTPLTDFETSDVDDIQSYLLDSIDEQLVMSQPVTPDSMTGEDAVMSMPVIQKPKGMADLQPSDQTVGDMEAQLEPAYMAAMQDFLAASGVDDKPAPGESREDALARYKKEFTDATGIDASGKVDKSQALMAFGLALMQNKAGKGFNVGKMLSAVGEAGAAAQPQLEKAIDRADAAKLAAGKYALQQIKNDENARAALAKEQRAAAQAARLKMLEFEQEAYLKGLEGKEITGGKALEVIPGLKVRIGQSDGKSVFERPEFTARTVGNSYKTTQTALGELNNLEGAIEEVAASGSPSVKIVSDRFNTFLVGLGMKDPNVTFGEAGTSPEQQMQALRDSLIAEFKRFLTQETGNGISKVDIQNIERLMGKMDIFGNPRDALNRVDQVRGIFEAKRDALVPFINDLQDPYYYVNQSAYDKAQESLAESMGFGGSRKAATQGDGRITIDLTE